MSDTPETDAKYIDHPWDMHDYIPLEFARKLERERDEARAEAAKWKANHDNQVALKSAIIQRPDLRDRAEIESMRDALKSALTLIEKMRIILIHNI
jgi:hypothetical protein